MTTAVSIVSDTQDRLDRVVTAALPSLSRSQVRRLIEEGHVVVEGVVAERASTPVTPGTHIVVDQPVLRDLDLAAEEVPLHVLYEDEETLVLDKQPEIGRAHV